jgi:hypothetical protein
VIGSVEGLETTLVSVLERRPAWCEIVLVLNTAYDDPYNLKDEIQILHADRRVGLVDCLNLGIQAASAPVVHFLQAGFEVDDQWIEQAVKHFENPLVAAVTPALYHAADRNSLYAVGVCATNRGQRAICQRQADAQRTEAVEPFFAPAGPLLQAAFYRKSIFTALGGIPTEVGDELADLDLALLLRAAGWRLNVEINSRLFGPEIATARTNGFQSGLQAERFFWRHAGERGLVRSVLAHPRNALAEMAHSGSIAKIPADLLGRMMAGCQFGSYRKYQQARLALADEAEAIRTAQQAAYADSREQTAHLRIDSAHQPTRSSERAAARSVGGSRARR